MFQNRSIFSIDFWFIVVYNTIEGEDIYEDKIHIINAEVFSINDISSECVVAAKFNGYANCYVYITENIPLLRSVNWWTLSN